jgi:hypothetical protein
MGDTETVSTVHWHWTARKHTAARHWTALALARNERYGRADGRTDGREGVRETGMLSRRMGRDEETRRRETRYPLRLGSWLN